MVTSCPAPEELKAWLQGRLAQPEEAVLDDHLDSCPRCQDLLRALDAAADPLLEELRGPTPAALVLGGDYQALLNKAQALRPGSSAPDRSSTLDLLPGETP